jgi:predicted short-subunit dehydrogenase-like oxidoreductase (DUF2520 family)
MKIGIIGAGTVGTALAIGLRRQGYQIAAVASRSRSSAICLARTALLPEDTVYESLQGVVDSSEFIFITVPDDAISTVADKLHWHPGQYVVHCSGADSLDVLEPARKAGARVGSFHPLQTFASISKAVENLPGSTFALEGEGELLETLKGLALALKGRSIKLEAGDKAIYHAAAVISSNYLVTLVKMSATLWESLGIPREQAIRALLPLLKGTINNIEQLGIPSALTGPIARGDIGTVQIHLDTLKGQAPAIVPAYCEMGLQTIPLAVAKGKINGSQARELEKLLRQTLQSSVERSDHACNVKE